MEFTVPGATRSCLIAGNAYNQSPVQVAVGLGNGAVELWDPASDSRDPLFRAHTSVVKQSGEDESSSDCSVSCGSITALSVVNARRVPPVVLAGTSSGTISQMYVNVEGMFNLKSGNVHRGVCTDISWCKETTHIASTGEDGVVNIFDLGDGDAAVSGESIKVLQSMRVDGSTINCVRWIDPYAVITAGNSPGKQLLLFDLRENTQMRNASAFGVQTSLTQFYSLALHPSNPNIVCTGADDGSISVWDIRKLSLLVHSEKVHDSMIWCLSMHPTSPATLLSGGEDGRVCFSSVGKPGAALVREFGMPVHSLDTCIDELAGPIMMASADDETVVVEQLLLD